MFHTFISQEERRSFGGSDFLEIQMCRLPRDTGISEILSVDSISHWQNSSLYVYGDDMEEFYREYGEIFRYGYYSNGEQGMPDCCGINYYTQEQMRQITEDIAEGKPKEWQVLLEWMENAGECNGMYLLGV